MRALLLAICIVSLPSLAQSQTILTWEQLSQKLKAQNSSIKSQQNLSAASETEEAQATLLTRPQLFADAMHGVDQSPILTPAFNGTKRQQDSYRLGLRKQWEFGLKGETYLLKERQAIDGAIGLQDPSLAIDRQGAGIAIDWSLWKNAWGRELSEQKRSWQAKAQGDRLLAKFQEQHTTLDAQLSYIRLAEAQESLRIHQDLVLQGSRLVDWVKRQVSDRLLESVHRAQAEVALEARRLQQAQKELEIKTLHATLNRLLEQNESNYPRLQSLRELERLIQRPSQLGARGDLKAKEKYVEAETAQYKIAEESVKPELSLKAQYAAYRKVSETDDTARCLSSKDCSSLGLQIEFSMPLGLAPQRSVERGLRARAQEKSFNLQADKQEAKAELETMQAQMLSISEQLRILQKLIDNRAERLRLERDRQGRGRASTFDLIQAEQDLFEAKNQALSLQSLRLQLLATLSLYEAQP